MADPAQAVLFLPQSLRKLLRPGATTLDDLALRGLGQAPQPAVFALPGDRGIAEQYCPHLGVHCGRAAVHPLMNDFESLVTGCG